MALYRKYRPATFAEVVGQEHVTDPLSTALDTGRISHAYLFSGPRGCGKTSSARILARSLNCVDGPTSTPCGVCPSCVALGPGGPGNLDVIELDAASHGGVDDTRELRDRAFYAPAESRYRVFIVDEAHMVTTAGFNALLKIVEEPPAHLIFIFATTEPDKVLPTIRSRTHHYPFRLLPPATMRGLLGRICEQENVPVEEAVYPLVIRAGGGSPRDSLSVLDQLLAGAGPEGVTYPRAVSLLGVTDVALIDDAVEALAADDGAALFGTVDRVMEAGHDPRRFAVDLLERFRDLILLRAVPDATDRGLVSGPGDVIDRMRAQAERLGPATLTRYAELLHEGLGEMRGATAPRLLLEVVCARMLLPSVSDAESATLQRLERLERGVATGAVAPAPAPASAVDAGPSRPAPAEPGRRRGAEALAAIKGRGSSGDPASEGTGGANRSAGGSGGVDPVSGGRAAEDRSSASGAAAGGGPVPPSDRASAVAAPSAASGSAGGADETGSDAATGLERVGPATPRAARLDEAARARGGAVAEHDAPATSRVYASGDSANAVPAAETADSGVRPESGRGGSTGAAERGANGTNSAPAAEAAGAGTRGATGGAERGVSAAGGDTQDPAGADHRSSAPGGPDDGEFGLSVGGEQHVGVATAAPGARPDADAPADATTAAPSADSGSADAAARAVARSADSGRVETGAVRADTTPRAETASAAAPSTDSGNTEAATPRAETAGTAARSADSGPPDAAASRAETPGAGGEAELLRAVEAAWGDIRSKVREFGTTVHALLSGASVSRIDGDTIVFTHQHAPLAKRLSDPKNLEAVRSAVRAVLGREHEVRWETGAAAAAAAAAAPPKAQAGGRARGGAATQQSAAGRSAPQASGRAQGAPAAPRYSRPSQANKAANPREGGGRPAGEPRSFAGEDDIPPPDYPDLPDDPGPGDYPPPDPVSDYGRPAPAVPREPTPEEEREMFAEAARPVAPEDRRDPDEVALELLRSELGATRLDG